jgi:hypothetical protein
MATPQTTAPSFLRDAFQSYAQFTVDQKQDAQKRALKWLQIHIQSDLSDQTILDQFAQKWRTGKLSPSNANDSPLHLENLPRSYKGTDSINAHQEEAFSFLEEHIPTALQDEFKARWEVKKRLKVSGASGTPLKIDETELETLQKNDPDGEGKTWYQVNKGDIYYVLSSEEKGENYLVVMTEEIGSENRNTWYVSKKDVDISNL